MRNTNILETIRMIEEQKLDIRTVTMGISLLDCIDPDPHKACEKIYRKITTRAANLVSTVEHISSEYGIPIINKRISVTPIAMLLGACPDADPVDFAKTLDAAGKKVGVNFVGGYTALVHKGFSGGDRRLIESIPRALAQTDIVCSSVNIGATKAGLNMDAIKLMGQAVKKSAELTADRQCIGAAKLVVFCNAPEDNPFMAGAFHGPGEPDCEIHVGVSGPVQVQLVNMYFDTTRYAAGSLPAGRYDAVRVQLGTGHSGKNWWCVLYPGLCRAACTTYAAPEENDLVCGEYIVRFKLVEWWHSHTQSREDIPLTPAVLPG